MTRSLLNVSIVVADYDAAIDFYVDKLDFRLLEDTRLSDTKRWVRVAPAESGTALLLAKADGPMQEAAIGNQAGGRVWLFLETDDFERDYELYRARGVSFLEKPRHETYGTVAVFEDICGNKWDLIEMTAQKI